MYIVSTSLYSLPIRLKSANILNGESKIASDINGRDSVMREKDGEVREKGHFDVFIILYIYLP